MGSASGGPAFPVVEPYTTSTGEVASAVHAGMDLRTWLAGQVAPSVYREWASSSPSIIAEKVWEFADALLAARER